MNRQAIRALVVFTLLAMIGSAHATVVASSSFEGTLGTWTHAGDPESSTSFVSGATIVPGNAHDGQSAVVLNADGSGPGGAVWLKSDVPVDPGTYRVTFSFWVYSCDDTSAASAEIIAAVGVGHLDRVSEFTPLGHVLPGHGWQHFSMTTTIEALRPLRVGLGLHRTVATNVKYTFDDVSVSVEPGGCKTDIDGSGSLTVEDVFAFVSGWFAGKHECDFDSSGRLDTIDIFAFLNAWFAGCPH